MTARCTVPPAGWYCTRPPGHDGPCAAHPAPTPAVSPEPTTPDSMAASIHDRTDHAAKLAQRFHETYERLAPSFGYETREASAKPWADVPENNRRLMTAVCAEILAASPAVGDALREAAAAVVARARGAALDPGLCAAVNALADALAKDG